jgi:hypothetical protein
MMVKIRCFGASDLFEQMLFTTCATGFFALEVIAFHRPVIPLWQFGQFIVVSLNMA